MRTSSRLRPLYLGVLVGLVAAMLASTAAFAAPKGPTGPPADLHCAGATSGNKIDADAFVGGQATWTDVPGDDGERYTVVGTLLDGKTIAFAVYDTNGAQVEGAETVFCVKGGPANSGGVTGEQYTVDFLNRGGQRPDISNVVVYSVVIPEDDGGTEEPCYQGETAWSAGARYTQQGNWAMYTPYAADTVAPLYAGQHHLVGQVTFGAVVDGKVTLTIDLQHGAKLQAGGDTVKIQGYTSAPSGNPAPGQFTSYKGTSLTVTVDAANFYGIHLDVLRLVDCG